MLSKKRARPNSTDMYSGSGRTWGLNVVFDPDKLENFLMQIDSISGVPIERFKGIFQTSAGWFLAELANGGAGVNGTRRFHWKESLYRSESRAELIAQSGQATLELVWDFLEAKALALDSPSRTGKENFRVAASINELAQIHEPEINLLIWKRPVRDWTSAIKHLEEINFGALQMIYNTSEPLDVIGAEFDEELKLEAPEMFALYNDIMEIARGFSNATKAQKIGIRLEAVRSDMCRFFHVDQVGIRLVYTYVGATTEWLRNADADRNQLGKGEEAQTLLPTRQPMRLPENSCGLMK